ncbi:MAG: DNA repair protein RecN [Pseudomonadota bacterium]
MLRHLAVRDIVLIERLALDLGPGLNALTGETGAGKSILLDALGLALGRGGRGEMVRAGAEQGMVTAVFDCPDGHPALALLEEAGIEPEPGEILLKRRVSAQKDGAGRASGFINDQRASAELLRAVGETLLEVHGQHDDRGLLNPRGHRAILDAFAGTGEILAQVREAWGELASARAALAEAEAAAEAAARDADWLRHASEELTALDPQEGEEPGLDAERRLAQAAARIREDVIRAAAALGGEGAEGRMADAGRWLEDAAAAAGDALQDEDGNGRLDAPLAALHRAFAELSEAQAGVETALEALDFDPARLEQTEERLFAIRGLARKHRVAADALPALTAELAARLEALDGTEARLDALEAHLRDAEADYDAAASTLSEMRREAAGRLDAAVAAELAPLKMERAVFATTLAEESAGPEGRDRVEFAVAPNPGAPPAALARIASGGELSRFLLALKVCLSAGAEEPKALIFDEIDRGVGGATAAAVGARLAALAQGAQVLVVTHSPQVAARADRHFRIEKSVRGEATRTDVTALEPGDRADEIARMLAGETVTDAAREAARALLEA